MTKSGPSQLLLKIALSIDNAIYWMMFVFIQFYGTLLGGMSTTFEN